MEERVKKHKTNLISLAVTCFAIGGLNFHLFASGNMMLVAFNLMYFILGMGCLYSYNLISTNLKRCATLSLILGILTFCIGIADGFCGYTENFRFLGWLLLFNGPALAIRSIKLRKDGTYY